MKKSLLLICVLLSSVAFASDIQCSFDPDKVQEEILASSRCSEAVERVETCGFGSMIDVFLAEAAAEVCFNEIGGEDRLSATDRELLELMQSRCNKTYEEIEGSMYLSLNAICELNATKFIVNNVYVEQNEKE